MPAGHREDRPGAALDVDHALVSALEQVEQAVATYLADLSQANLDRLGRTLARLDDQTAASDSWSRSIASAGIWGSGDVHVAIGQTAMVPVIDQEDSSLFRAQVALVQAAKTVVHRPDPGSVESLRAASASVEDHTDSQ